MKEGGRRRRRGRRGGEAITGPLDCKTEDRVVSSALSTAVRSEHLHDGAQ